MDKQKEIAKVAYELYVCSDCKEGRDLDNWLEAESILLAKESVKDEIKLEPVTELVQLEKEIKLEELPVVL